MTKTKWIAVLLVLLLPLVLASWRGTRNSWETFRTVSATEDTQLTAATQNSSVSTSTDGILRIRRPVGALAIILKGTAAADKTLSWTLWARKSTSSPAEYVAHGTATTGATQTGETNEFYCDTIAITGQQWYTTASVVNGAPDTIVSGGGISKLAVDSCEYEVWQVIIRDIAGGGAEAATAGADVTNFAL